LPPEIVCRCRQSWCGCQTLRSTDRAL